MIGSSHRFHGHGSLRYVYQQGRSIRHSQCILRYAINNRRKTYRIAVVVSRKVHKSAVTRNRIRRRIYELVRQEASQITKPFDLVFIVLDESLAEMPIANLKKIITNSLLNAEVLTSGQPASHAIVRREKKER